MLLGANFVASRSRTRFCLTEKLARLKEEVTAREAELEETMKIFSVLHVESWLM